MSSPPHLDLATGGNGDPDAIVLQSIGTDILRAFISVVVETWLVAVYSVLVVKASQILIKKTSLRDRGLHAIVLVMYAMDLVLWIIDVRNIVVELDLTLIRGGSMSLDDRYASSSSEVLRLSIVEDVLYSYMVVLGDFIIVSRVFAFWWDGLRERLMIAVPCMVYFVSIVLSILVTFCGAQSGAEISLGAFTHPAFCSNIQTTSYWTQLATAVVATGLIGIKGWRHRKLIRDYLGAESYQSPVMKIMVVLVDTGLIYVLYFLLEVIFNFNSVVDAISAHPGLAFALEIYSFTTSSIVGIYPTIVVILVHTQGSLLNSATTTAAASSVQFRNARATNTTLRFGLEKQTNDAGDLDIITTGEAPSTSGVDQLPLSADAGREGREKKLPLFVLRSDSGGSERTVTKLGGKTVDVSNAV